MAEASTRSLPFYLARFIPFNCSCPLVVCILLHDFQFNWFLTLPNPRKSKIRAIQWQTSRRLRFVSSQDLTLDELLARLKLDSSFSYHYPCFFLSNNPFDLYILNNFQIFKDWLSKKEKFCQIRERERSCKISNIVKRTYDSYFSMYIRRK